jgi:hypothetical protein
MKLRSGPLAILRASGASTAAESFQAEAERLASPAGSVNFAPSRFYSPLG